MRYVIHFNDRNIANMKTLTHSEQETIDFGKKTASQLHGGDVLLLYGDLGAGKTTLVKGIAQGLNIKEEITSPTFTLMNVCGIKNYELGIKNLVHIDTYRLEDEEDLIEIGVEDYLGDENTICVVEWPEKVEGLLGGKKIIKIEIENLGEEKRDITCHITHNT